MQELRCDHKLHGKLIDAHTLETRCDSKFCGKAPGVVVIHRFDLRTGTCTTTRYSEPPTITRKGANSGS